MLSATEYDACPNCGQEWPSRYGPHICNMRREYVHNKAIIMRPGAGVLESLERLTIRHMDEAKRSAEYADLGGAASPYPELLADVDAAIGFLKRYRASLQALSKHAHDWNASDYCTICGADGRA